ncbi:UDP-Glycosyltransferase/glycogen phosphorylase [Basidiobolus meristosporus CBS 931.73]|uniref:UDP-Glycosyltransferase/glycogen phosphorylase n=1 Tax=Basidiobolus meristosporus CBS 931.73 TaxID=1314790 RepID=A0A1Y1Y288_9FUNG|nr:UDP-Glycosyltransferase/glycogen phosphorylase [Basidiobolus meristosporus CBS 931.73]|eukprot:ORX92131.1 UDP-Glycosyltransferase/glycogen phosphorylase [Basidiobolus meristosporus CBS 931.73]
MLTTLKPSSEHLSSASSGHLSEDDHIRIMVVQVFPGLFAAAGGPRSDKSLLEALSLQGHEALLFLGCFAHEVEDKQVTINSVEIIHPPTEQPKEVRLYRLTVNQISMVAYCIDDLGGNGFLPQMFPSEWLLGKGENKMLDFYTNLIRKEVRQFQPSHFLYSDLISQFAASEFMPQEKSGIKTIAITHVTNILPFGPQDVNPVISATWPEDFNPTYTKLLESKVTGVWAVSKAVQEYIYRYGSTRIPVKHFPLHPSRFDVANAPKYANFDNPEARVLAINPGTLKGFSIFYPLAVAMPDTKFLAVRSWDVSEYQASQLADLPNVELLAPMPTLEPVWQRTKILVVPSIWLETFGNVVVEAMLRGIPVVCSNAGGVPEAKCGILRGTIPVVLATNERELDEEEIKRHGPLKIPQNDIQPWIDEINLLLNDRELYERISTESREAALSLLDIQDSDYVTFLNSF